MQKFGLATMLLAMLFCVVVSHLSASLSPIALSADFLHHKDSDPGLAHFIADLNQLQLLNR